MIFDSLNSEVINFRSQIVASLVDFSLLILSSVFLLSVNVVSKLAPKPTRLNSCTSPVVAFVGLHVASFVTVQLLC